MELTINSEVFEDLRQKFNISLQKLFNNIQTANASEGTLTLKVDVEIRRINVPTYEDGVQVDDRDIDVPSFNYKVTSSVPIKDETKGNKDPQMELKFDESTKTYNLGYINNLEQRSIFDDDMQDVDSIEQSVIEGGIPFLIEDKEQGVE